MTYTHSPYISDRQYGLSLVELMVAMVIGLVLLGAISYIMIGGRLMNRSNDDVSRMQENGRYAMETIGKAIRNAGYRLNTNADVALGKHATETALGQTAPAPNGVAAISGTEGAGGAPDTITLRHDPGWQPNAASSMSGVEENCAGDTITSNINETGGRPANLNLVVHTFSISNGNLVCNSFKQDGTASNPATIVENIQDMQIQYGQYGVDGSGNITGVIASYVNADAIADPSRIAAIRVSLLVRSANRGTTTGMQTYYFNNALHPANDGFLRLVYTSTFSVRNQVR